MGNSNKAKDNCEDICLKPGIADEDTVAYNKCVATCKRLNAVNSF